MIFGMVFMEGTWLIISIILALIGLIAIGYFYGSFEDDCFPKAICEVLFVVLIAIFWPIILCIIGCILVVMIPILLGVGIKIFIANKSKNKPKLSNREMFEKELLKKVGK